MGVTGNLLVLLRQASVPSSITTVTSERFYGTQSPHYTIVFKVFFNLASSPQTSGVNQGDGRSRR